MNSRRATSDIRTPIAGRRPRYLASPGGLSLPQVLRDLSSLISGGVGGVVGK